MAPPSQDGEVQQWCNKPPLTTIAAQLFCVNPTRVFFLAAFSKLLFAMLTFAGHAFIARGRYFNRLLQSKGGGGRLCKRGITGGKEWQVRCIVDGSGQTSTHHCCIITLLSSHPPQLQAVAVDNGGSS
jgi:hypothetical protein